MECLGISCFVITVLIVLGILGSFLENKEKTGHVKSNEDHVKSDEEIATLIPSLSR